MVDPVFNNLQQGLRRIHISGGIAVIFPKAKEREIRNGIFERYGEREDGKVYLSNIEMIFI